MLNKIINLYYYMQSSGLVAEVGGEGKGRRGKKGAGED